MSSLKSLAKQAREAINDKDFESALHFIDTAFSDEEINGNDNAALYYNLLVFRALALNNLQRTAEAIEFYERAGMRNPSLPLAWQGLLNLYEESRAENSKIVKPLERLLAIYKSSRDTGKHYSTAMKLLQKYRLAKDFPTALALCRWLLSEEATEFYGNEIIVDRKQVLLDLVSIREAQDDDFVEKEVQKRKFRLGAGPIPVIMATVRIELAATSDINEIYEGALETLAPSDNQFAILSVKLGKNLARKCPSIPSVEGRKSVWDRVVQLGSKFYDEELFEMVLEGSDCDYTAAWIQEFAKRYATDNTGRFVGEIQFLVLNQNVKLPSDSPSLLSNWARTFQCWQEADYEEFLNCVPKLLAAIAIAEKRTGSTLVAMKAFVTERKPLALVAVERFQDAQVLLDALAETQEIFEAKLKCAIALDDWERSIELLKRALIKDPANIQNLSQLGWAYLKIGELVNSQLYLSKAEDVQPENPEVLFRLGLLKWKQQDRDAASTYWLKTIKSDANFAAAYNWLGKYYSDKSDLIRAEKCFIKALKLDSSLVDAAVGLAQIWIDTNWNDAARQHGIGLDIVGLLEGYTHAHLRNWLLWKALGLGYAWIGSKQNAITAFQNALKGEHPHELTCLRLLAEAYRKDKKLSAAIKAYSRALEVDPGSMLAMVGLVTVKMEVGSNEEAIDELAKMIGMSEGRSELKVMLVKAHYQHARSLMLDSNLLEARVSILRGLEVVLELASTHSFMLWWTAAHLIDLSRVYSQRPDFKEITNLAKSFTGEASYPIERELVESMQDDVARAAAYSLVKCLHLVEANRHDIISNIWCELGRLCYDSDLIHLAETCVNQSLSHNSSQYEAWNLYGMISLAQGRYAFSQHCFVSSLELADTSHVWINLAYLYLKLEDVALAQQAIEKAQMADVDNPVTWYASAQMAGLESSRAQELLEEAIQCGKSTIIPSINEAFVSASWPIEDHLMEDRKFELLKRLQSAAKRLHDLNPDDTWTSNMLGLIYEWTEPTNETVALFKDPTNLCRSLLRTRKQNDVQENADDDLKNLYFSFMNGNFSYLSSYLEKIDKESEEWEMVAWMTVLLCLTSRDHTTIDHVLGRKPGSVAALTGKLLVAQDDDTAEMALLEALDACSSLNGPLNSQILWVLTRYLCHKQCYLEATQFYLSIVERSIFDENLRESFAKFVDELREVSDEETKETCMLAIKEWLDIQVPQLPRKPKLEQLEDYYDRLFPALPVAPLHESSGQ